MKLPIYLDYSATTPADPRVAEKMMQCLTLDGIFGNPASRSHRFHVSGSGSRGGPSPIRRTRLTDMSTLR